MPTTRATVAEAITGYLDYCSTLRGLADVSVITYAHRLRTFFALVLRDPLESLTTDRLARIASEARKRPSTAPSAKRSPNTGATFILKLATARSFTTWARDVGLISTNPLAHVRTPHLRHTARSILRGEDVARIAAQATPLSPYDARDRAAVWTLFTSGVRIGELLRLRVRDLEWATDTEATIYVNEPEKRGDPRRVEVYDDAARALASYLHYDRPQLVTHSDPGLIFVARPGRPMSYTAFKNTLAHWANAADIPVTPVIPHLLRHSCATIRAENGMETVALQRYMGWKSIDTALHYVHLSGRHVLDAARAARPVLPVGHVEDRV